MMHIRQLLVDSLVGVPLSLARNCVTFRRPIHSTLVTLMDAFHFFEVHISLIFFAKRFAQLEVLAGIRAACEKLHYSNDHPFSLPLHAMP